MTRMITIDGSQGEGGGQILRTALTLSLLTGKPFRVTRIRANRANPGLRAQHLKAVEAAMRLGGDAVGATIGSQELTFRPAPYEPRDLTISIGTAGSTGLVLHTLHLPIAMRAQGPIRLTLEGGTFNTKAPSFPFLRETWRRYMARLGLTVHLAMPAAGHFPRGGGRLDAWIEPGAPRPITLIERAPLSRLTGEAGVTNLPFRQIADRMRDRALERLGEHGLDGDLSTTEWPGPGQGAAIALSVEHGDVSATFVGLGERGKPAERVADEAVAELLAYEDSEGVVDPHSADQLLVPLALAEGRSVFSVAEVTDHLRTNAETIRAFLDTPIRVDEPDEGPARVIVG
jgi:RNA 3'-terminal phosphate cyclase (ATP)